MKINFIISELEESEVKDSILEEGSIITLPALQTVVQDYQHETLFLVLSRIFTRTLP